MSTSIDLKSASRQSVPSKKRYKVRYDSLADAFRNLRIGEKVFFGFCLVLLIIVAIVGISNINTMSFRAAFGQQMTQVDEAQKIFEIDKKISELQKYILIYSHAGQLGAFRRAQAMSHEVLEDLTKIFKAYEAVKVRTRSESQDAVYREKLYIINSMIKIIESYPAKLQELFDERLRSTELTTRGLNDAREKIESQVTKLRKWEVSYPDDALIHETASFDRDFVQQQRQILEFFYSRKFVLFDSISQSFSKLNSTLQNIATLSSALDSSLQKDIVDVDGIIEDYKNYEDLFFRATQASRGYLYLVNVVLAGETAEFLSLSSRLRTLTFTNLVDTADASRLRIENTQKVTNLASVSAIGLGFALALFIGASISRPIRNITAAVQRLAAGESDQQIPGLTRGDEIGQIARAADVFKDMNIQTEVLLAETRRLAEDLRLREKMLEKKTQELEKTNEDLDNFAYVASHDLKSPLRGIDNLASWIEEDCFSILPDESVGHLKTLRSRISRMEGLLTDLLAYSRAGRVEQALEMVDVGALLTSTFEFIDQPAGSKLNLLSAMPCILTQKAPFRQVFLNLFTNAIKYSDKAAPIVEVALKDEHQDYFQFSVADNGPGIDALYHDKIFKMFQTLQARDIIEGSGMGLAIIKRVIENFGGSISVESSPGEGATFFFTWPKSMPTAANAEL